MRRFLPPRLLIAFGLILSLVLVPSASSVYAQAPEATNGLEISPVLVELNADPAKTYTIDIKVRNVTTSNLYFETSVDDFGAKNESGAPSILLEESAEPLPTSIKTWVRPVGSFALAPNEDRAIKATINVPDGAEPGGHYGVIRFAGHKNADERGNVGLVASAGTLVLVSVSGEAKESLTLASFDPSSNGTNAGFFEKGPITFVSRFTNNGSVHVKPIGQIEVRDSFGNSVASLPVNDAKGNVLPGSTRRFESTLNKDWMFGQYTADLSIAYGNTGQAIVRTISFWVIPWKILLVALLVFVTVAYVLRIVVKRYNQHIISKDRKKRK